MTLCALKTMEPTTNNLLNEHHRYRWAYKHKRDPEKWLHIDPLYLGKHCILFGYHDSILCDCRDLLENDFKVTRLNPDDWELVKIKMHHEVVPLN